MILIDTTPLVALCDARDSKHRMALKHLESLAADDFAVCDAVLTQACFHLPHRTQRQRLRALLRDLNVQPIPIMHERDFFLEVLDWLTKYADHEPDWADACLAILSGRDRDLKVWTYDRSSGQRGADRTGRPFPGRSGRCKRRRLMRKDRSYKRCVGALRREAI